MPKQIENLEIVMLDKLTEGQAITALAALDGIPDDAMVTFAACDNGMIYDAKAFKRPDCSMTKKPMLLCGAPAAIPSLRANRRRTAGSMRMHRQNQGRQYFGKSAAEQSRA